MIMRGREMERERIEILSIYLMFIAMQMKYLHHKKENIPAVLYSINII